MHPGSRTIFKLMSRDGSSRPSRIVVSKRVGDRLVIWEPPQQGRERDVGLSRESEGYAEQRAVWEQKDLSGERAMTGDGHRRGCEREWR
jgi:hypothetical protein